MRVNLKCFTTLANPATCDFSDATAYELEKGQTVKHLTKLAWIKSEEIKIAFVNSSVAKLDTVLSEGDRVALTPANAAFTDASSHSQ